MVVKQMLSLVAGGTVDLFIAQKLHDVTSKHTIARLLLRTRNILWPGGDRPPPPLSWGPSLPESRMREARYQIRHQSFYLPIVICIGRQRQSTPYLGLDCSGQAHSSRDTLETGPQPCGYFSPRDATPSEHVWSMARWQRKQNRPGLVHDRCRIETSRLVWTAMRSPTRNPERAAAARCCLHSSVCLPQAFGSPRPGPKTSFPRASDLPPALCPTEGSRRTTG